MLGQDVDTPPVIIIDNYQVEVVHEFTYLGSTITDNLSLDAELNKRIGKAVTTLERLATRVWENSKLTTKTKMAVYNACVVSTLLYKIINAKCNNFPTQNVITLLTQIVITPELQLCST